MREADRGVYLADLLALQTLNGNLTCALNLAGEIGHFFTTEAVYQEDRRNIKGRKAIEAYFAELSSKRKTRHSFNVGSISVSDDGQASGVLLYVRYRDGEEGAPLVSIYDVNDTYELGDDGIWRVSTRAIGFQF